MSNATHIQKLLDDFGSKARESPGGISDALRMCFCDAVAGTRTHIRDLGASKFRGINFNLKTGEGTTPERQILLVIRAIGMDGSNIVAFANGPNESVAMFEWLLRAANGDPGWKSDTDKRGGATQPSIADFVGSSEAGSTTLRAAGSN